MIYCFILRDRSNIGAISVDPDLIRFDFNIVAIPVDLSWINWNNLDTGVILVDSDLINSFKFQFSWIQ